jgi:hypothetical protein
VKIRFNLERGQYYNQWQISNGDSSQYLEPDTIFVLENCTLINKPNIAKKIYNGANKQVCAWIEFDTMTFLTEVTCSPDEIRYNPRENPFWTYKGKNADGQMFDELYVIGRKIYAS